MCCGERGSLPVSQHMVATIPHSEQMRIVPAGTCLHHSSPGPGNGPDRQVPPGILLCLPGKPSIRRQRWRDPVISSIAGRACSAVQAGTGLWLREDSSSSQGSWRRLGGAVSPGVQLSSGLFSEPWSKGVRADGFLNTTKPPRWWESSFSTSYYIATPIPCAERVCHSSVLDPSTPCHPVPKQTQACQRHAIHAATISVPCSGNEPLGKQTPALALQY